MLFINTIIVLLLIIVPGFLIIRLHKLRANILINIKYWLILFGYFYVLVPSFFIDFSNTLQDWNFTNSTIITAKLFSIYFMIAILAVSFFIKDKEIEMSKSLKLQKSSSMIVLIIWIAIVLYSSYATFRVIGLLSSFQGLERVTFGNMLEEFTRTYKLKSLLFFSLTIATIKYWEKGNILYFIPLLILSVNDVVAGGRTMAFFSIIGIYLNIAIKNGKLYIAKISILLAILLVSVTASRMGTQIIDASMNSINNYIYQSLGEFIQTYNGFCYSIQNNFSSANPIGEIISNSLQGILPGFVKFDLGLIDDTPGVMLAKKIGRGYGLGLNILAEAYYYGGWIALLASPIFLTVIVQRVSSALLKLKFPGFVGFLFMTIYIRLFFREGIIANIFIPIYLLVIYGFLSFIWAKFIILKFKIRAGTVKYE